MAEKIFCAVVLVLALLWFGYMSYKSRKARKDDS